MEDVGNEGKEGKMGKVSKAEASRSRGSSSSSSSFSSAAAAAAMAVARMQTMADVFALQGEGRAEIEALASAAAAVTTVAGKAADAAASHGGDSSSLAQVALLPLSHAAFAQVRRSTHHVTIPPPCVLCSTSLPTFSLCMCVT